MFIDSDEVFESVLDPRKESCILILVAIPKVLGWRSSNQTGTHQYDQQDTGKHHDQVCCAQKFHFF